MISLIVDFDDERPVIGNAGPGRGIEVCGRPVGSHLVRRLIRDADRSCANLPCCFFATRGREQDHVEEGPGVVAPVVVGAAAVLAHILRHGPVGADVAVEQVFACIFGAGRIEVAGGALRSSSSA